MIDHLTGPGVLSKAFYKNLNFTKSVDICLEPGVLHEKKEDGKLEATYFDKSTAVSV
jgi:hypothetical protein